MTAGLEDAAGVPRAIAVWLRAPVAAPSTGQPTVGTPTRSRATAAQPTRRRAGSAGIVAPAAQAPQDMLALPPAAPQGGQDGEPPGSRFDFEAARRGARQLASEPDPGKAGTALERLPETPLATETRAARAIAGTHRRDCKDGLPGGLLGPLIILLDKKDSGCKW